MNALKCEACEKVFAPGARGVIMGRSQPITKTEVVGYK